LYHAQADAQLRRLRFPPEAQVSPRGTVFTFLLIVSTLADIKRPLEFVANSKTKPQPRRASHCQPDNAASYITTCTWTWSCEQLFWSAQVQLRPTTRQDSHRQSLSDKKVGGIHAPSTAGSLRRRPNLNPHRPANRIHAPSAPTSSHLSYSHAGVVHCRVQHQRDSRSCHGSC
jgi:hypothetical protein